MQQDSGDFPSLKSVLPAPDSTDRRSLKLQGPATPGPELEILRCPRCDSMNTKFCYYNNYNLSQPRHFCKSCRRYWTKGGALRNIPVGGGSRKNAKRSTTATKAQAVQPISVAAAGECESPAAVSDDGERVFDGSFGSLLGSSGYFGALGEPFHGWSLNLGFQKQGTVISGSGGFEETGFGRGLWPLQEIGESGVGNSWQGNGGEGFEGDCWGGNGWPELAISAPGKSLQ